VGLRQIVGSHLHSHCHLQMEKAAPAARASSLAARASSPATNAGSPAEKDASLVARKSTILAVQACIFFVYSSISIPGSSISVLNKSMGGTASSLGSARTAALLWNLVVGLFMSPIINSVGTKPALIAVCALAGSGILIFSLTTTTTMLYAGIIVGGARIHLLTCGKTMIADLCEPEELPNQFGTIGMISGIAFVTGPIFSIILTKTIGCVYGAGCLSALLALGIATSLPGTSSHSAGKDAAKESSPGMSIRDAVPYLLVSAACTAPFATIILSLDMYLVQRFGIASSGIAAVTVVMAVSYAISQGALFKRMHQRLGSVPLLFVGGAFVATPLLVIDYLESILGFTMLLVVSVLGMGCCQGAVDVLMVELTTPNKSRGTAWAATISNVNMVLVPGASGIIVDAGLPLFRISASLCVAGAAIGYLVLPRRSQQHKKPE